MKKFNLSDRTSLPRKLKKKFFGKIINKNKLKKMVDLVGRALCDKCGCKLLTIKTPTSNSEFMCECDRCSYTKAIKILFDK